MTLKGQMLSSSVFYLSRRDIGGPSALDYAAFSVGLRAFFLQPLRVNQNCGPNSEKKSAQAICCVETL